MKMNDTYMRFASPTNLTKNIEYKFNTLDLKSEKNTKSPNDELKSILKNSASKSIVSLKHNLNKEWAVRFDKE